MNASIPLKLSMV